MTREQTVDLVRSIVGIYPNWKPDNLTETVNAWHWALEEYPAEAIKAALQIYVKSSNTGFAPSVSQLIGCMYKPQENKQCSEGDAWYLVKKAISDGNYHSQERFDELPLLVQRAVGGAEMIRYWATCDSDEVNTVVMSNFQRNYRAILSKQDFENRIPSAVSEIVLQVSEKVAPPKAMISESKE